VTVRPIASSDDAASGLCCAGQAGADLRWLRVSQSDVTEPSFLDIVDWSVPILR
jgi:hypothetical protein